MCSAHAWQVCSHACTSHTYYQHARMTGNVSGQAACAVCKHGVGPPVRLVLWSSRHGQGYGCRHGTRASSCLHVVRVLLGCIQCNCGVGVLPACQAMCIGEVLCGVGLGRCGRVRGCLRHAVWTCAGLMWPMLVDDMCPHLVTCVVVEFGVARRHRVVAGAMSCSLVGGAPCAGARGWVSRARSLLLAKIKCGMFVRTSWSCTIGWSVAVSFRLAAAALSRRWVSSQDRP